MGQASEIAASQVWTAGDNLVAGMHQAPACSGTTWAAPAIPSSACANRCNAAATWAGNGFGFRSQPTGSGWKRGSCCLDDVGQFAHLAKHGRAHRLRSWRVQPDVPLAFCNVFVSRSRLRSGAPVDVAKMSASGFVSVALNVSTQSRCRAERRERPEAAGTRRGRSCCSAASSPPL